MSGPLRGDHLHGHRFEPYDKSHPWKLPNELIKLSKAGTWGRAIKEWTLVSVELLDSDEENEHCLCGHPIREICTVRNKLNHNTAIIGNRCIMKFGNDATEEFQSVGNICKGLKKIKRSYTKAPNQALIEHCFKQNIITERDKKFCEDTIDKKRLTEGQEGYRYNLNRQIIDGLKKAHLSYKRVLTSMKADSTYSPNPQLIDLAERENIITSKDATFLKDIWARAHETLTPKQASYKVSLNTKIFTKVSLPEEPLVEPVEIEQEDDSSSSSSGNSSSSSEIVSDDSNFNENDLSDSDDSSSSSSSASCSSSSSSEIGSDDQNFIENDLSDSEDGSYIENE